jgi:hypothetical protein
MYYIAFLWLIVRLLIVFNQIYSYDVHYILYHWAVKTDESEISYVCKYVRPCDEGWGEGRLKEERTAECTNIYSATFFFSFACRMYINRNKWYNNH